MRTASRIWLPLWISISLSSVMVASYLLLVQRTFLQINKELFLHPELVSLLLHQLRLYQLRIPLWWPLTLILPISKIKIPQKLWLSKKQLRLPELIGWLTTHWCLSIGRHLLLFSAKRVLHVLEDVDDVSPDDLNGVVLGALSQMQLAVGYDVLGYGLRTLIVESEQLQLDV